MKKLCTLLTALILVTSVFAQAPELMSYQAVVRDVGNTLVANQSVGMQLSILQGSVSGTEVYAETQTPTTNINGLVSLEIGSGTVVSGTFNTIDWSSGPYFLKTDTDPTGGTNYSITGTSQLMSVPYALHANTADSIVGGIVSSGYSIGDFVHGGIVFWVDETGEHGLVCAKEDQSSELITWSNLGNVNDSEAHGDGPLSGEMNTILIIVSEGSNSNDYAAGVCANLQITEGGKTYGDWYLPSKEELNQMYLNKLTIDATALLNNGGVFASSFYWSSTEDDNFFAWGHDFSTGSQANTFKVQQGDVRAVRTF